MSQPNLTLQEALRMAVEANKFLQGVSHDPMRALAIIEPYADRDDLTGGSAEQVQKSRSIVCGVMGDCYQELGDFHTSANWYRRASGYSKVGGFPLCYAELVVKHELTEHYEDVLDCLRSTRKDWKSRPLKDRLYYHFVSRWWLYPSMWKLLSRERSLISQLESLVAERHRSR